MVSADSSSRTVPSAKVTSLSEIADTPSFARYMERCLYDPSFGYYSSGKVIFGKGDGKHFWTYPQRMSPFFGQMLAETARECFQSMLDAGELEEGTPITILELGAGNGDLARDTLDHIVKQAGTPRWRALASRVRYVIGERSPALRERQLKRLGVHAEEGRAEVREVDAINLQWSGPFQGMVVANELIDAFPCERIRLRGAGLEHATRVHVAPLIQRSSAIEDGLEAYLVPPNESLDELAMGGEMLLAEEGLWRWVAMEPRERANVRFVELEVPLTLGWGTQTSLPDTLQDYLESLAPMIRDLAACSELPVDLFWAEGAAKFIKQLGSVISGPDRRGVAILIDYGGNSRHVLDPNSMGPHFRVYGDERARAHRSLAYDDPGDYDMTWDVDFTEVARIAGEVGMEMRYFGHQSILEAPPIDLWSKDIQPILIRARVNEGTHNMFQATLEAHNLVSRFRNAAGFRLIALSTAGLSFPEERFGQTDPVSELGLWTLGPAYDPVACALALKSAGLPPEIAEYIKPCGDLVADLCDRHHYSHRHAVFSLLQAQGWLCAPGGLQHD